MFLNLRDFGAKGDGVANDTAALNALLAAAARDGSTAYIPAGTYRIDPVKVPGHITIQGNASWGYSAWGYENNHLYEDEEPTDPMINGHTVFVPASTDGEALFDLGGACGTRIIGVSLDGEMLGENFHGIRACGAGVKQNLVFEDLRICHFTGNGLQIPGVEGFALRRSLIIKNVGHAVVVSGARDGSIIDNQLAYNNGAGFWGVGAGTGLFTICANRIEGGDPGGVYLEDADGVTLTGNSFDYNLGSAVTLLRCDGGAVGGNMTRGSGHGHMDDCSSQIRLEYCSGLSVTGNASWVFPTERKSEQPVYFGMVLRELTDCIVTGNTFRDACQSELIRDYGGHKNTIIDDNPGLVYIPNDLR